MLYFIIAGLIVVGWAAWSGAHAIRGERGSFVATVLAALALVGWTIISSITVVPAGHVGVAVVFGEVLDTPLYAGLRYHRPWADVLTMSIRMQEIKEAADVPSSDQLNVSLDVSMQYNLNPEMAPQVYRTIGRDYEDIFIRPQLRSHIRGATAAFEAKALYTSDRDQVERLMEVALSPTFEGRGFVNTEILLRQVSLPTLVTNAIEKKLQAEQQAEQMRFVIERERQEAERKRIEAQGIADFQAIVTQGIDERLLRWKGIEATQALAESDNSKIVIVGGQDGLPVIFNSR